ncbi:uncharacterized protein A4U43_C05F13680, partial [Asparagus officinalis]
NSDDDDFEFSFIRIPDSGPPIAADDIFSDGKIRPIYPVFGKRTVTTTISSSPSSGSPTQALRSPPTTSSPTARSAPSTPSSAAASSTERIRTKMMNLQRPGTYCVWNPNKNDQIKKRSSSAGSSSSLRWRLRSASSSSSTDELDRVPPGTYCVWNPNKNDQIKKRSSSAGSSSSLRWRLRDLVVGRSRSNGKEKFVFIPVQEEENGGEKEIGKDNNNNRGKKASGKKSTASTAKTFLPYRPDIVGFFANVNGANRTAARHPF